MLLKTDQIMSWEPCPDWPRDRVALYAGAGITPQEVAALPIKAADRYWVLVHCLCPHDQRRLSAAVAERALMRARVTDQRSWDAIRVARLHAMGEASDVELDAPRYAPRYAPRAAARAAAWTAARVPALEAALEAAWEAAWEATLETAWEAARKATWEAAIADALRFLEAA